MADETPTPVPVKTEEFMTDKHIKKYMIVTSFLMITGVMFMYALKMFKEASPEFLARFDGMVLVWYSVATLALTFPTIAIEAIKAVKGK